MPKRVRSLLRELLPGFVVGEFGAHPRSRLRELVTELMMEELERPGPRLREFLTYFVVEEFETRPGSRLRQLVSELILEQLEKPGPRLAEFLEHFVAEEFEKNPDSRLRELAAALMVEELEKSAPSRIRDLVSDFVVEELAKTPVGLREEQLLLRINEATRNGIPRRGVLAVLNWLDVQKVIKRLDQYYTLPEVKTEKGKLETHRDGTSEGVASVSSNTAKEKQPASEVSVSKQTASISVAEWNPALNVLTTQRAPIVKLKSGECQLPIYFTTERMVDDHTEQVYARQSDWNERHFGMCNTVFPKQYRITPPVNNFLYAVLAKLPRNETQKPRVERPATFDEGSFDERLRTELANCNSHHVLIYIHGAQVDLKGAIEQAAIVAFNTNFPGPTIAYAWPTDSYIRDLELAPHEAARFGDWLTRFHEKHEGIVCHIVAHSLGSVVAMKGLADLRNTVSIGEFTVAAPDIQKRIFDELAPKALQHVTRGTAYVSNGDLALRLSGLTRLEPRVGASPVLAIRKGFDVVDAAKHGGDGTFFQHDVAFRGPLCKDLGELLRGVPQQRTNLEENDTRDWYQLRK